MIAPLALLSDHLDMMVVSQEQRSGCILRLLVCTVMTVRYQSINENAHNGQFSGLFHHDLVSVHRGACDMLMRAVSLSVIPTAIPPIDPKEKCFFMLLKKNFGSFDPDVYLLFCKPWPVSNRFLVARINRSNKDHREYWWTPNKLHLWQLHSNIW